MNSVLIAVGLLGAFSVGFLCGLFLAAWVEIGKGR